MRVRICAFVRIHVSGRMGVYMTQNGVVYVYLLIYMRMCKYLCKRECVLVDVYDCAYTSD